MIWLRRIEEASTEQDVLAILREYVSSLSVREIEDLPHPWRPAPTMGETQLAICANALMAYPAHGENSRLIHKVADTLSAGMVRLRELRRPR